MKPYILFIVLIFAVSTLGQNNTTVAANVTVTATPTSTVYTGPDASILTTFASFRALYNQKNFTQLYALITISQNQTSQTSFVANLTAIYLARGPIAYDLYFQNKISADNLTLSYYHAVAYNNSLQLGVVSWKQQNGSVSKIDFGSPLANQPLINLFNNNISQVALSVFLQGNETIKFNKNRQQPIDSLSTIPYTLEYARQVGANLQYPQKMFPIYNVKRFFIPKVDLGIQGFKSDARAPGVTVNGAVNLAFVAPEMTQFFVAQGSNNFASNAVAEFMLDTLGKANVDATIKNIGLVQTTTVYPASAILAFTNFKGQKKNDYNNFKLNMTFASFLQTQKFIHSKLLLGKSNHLLQNAQYSFLSQNFRANYYKYSVCSTTFQYATLMQNINTNMVPTFTQATLTAAMAILTPVSQQQPFEQKQFTSDAGAVVQTRDIFNAAGYTNLIKSVNGTTQISFALLVQGLSKVQQKQYGGQLSIFVYFISSNPMFVVDFGTRLSPTQ